MEVFQYINKQKQSYHNDLPLITVDLDSNLTALYGNKTFKEKQQLLEQVKHNFITPKVVEFYRHLHNHKVSFISPKGIIAEHGFVVVQFYLPKSSFAFDIDKTLSRSDRNYLDTRNIIYHSFANNESFELPEEIERKSFSNKIDAQSVIYIFNKHFLNK